MINIKQGEEIYNKIKAKLKERTGKMVAIDIETGEYFVGNDSLEACHVGKKKYPSKQFYLRRIGAKYTYVVSVL